MEILGIVYSVIFGYWYLVLMPFALLGIFYWRQGKVIEKEREKVVDKFHVESKHDTLGIEVGEREIEK